MVGFEVIGKSGNLEIIANVFAVNKPIFGVSLIGALRQMLVDYVILHEDVLFRNNSIHFVISLKVTAHQKLGDQVGVPDDVLVPKNERWKSVLGDVSTKLLRENHLFFRGLEILMRIVITESAVKAFKGAHEKLFLIFQVLEDLWNQLFNFKS